MTRRDQMRINRAYANIKAALDELAQIPGKDKYLQHMQAKLYAMEDVIYQYVAPVMKEVSK